MRTTLTYFVLVLLCVACQTSTDKQLPSFEVFCEMVANNTKPVAFSHPMMAAELDRHWDDFQRIAESYNVSLHREVAFPVTLLFPSSATEGKEVAVIYKDARLIQYQQLKDDVANADPANEIEQRLLAKRMGRLLGYSPQGINELLMKNTEFRTLSSFNVQRQVTHLYYDDPAKASAFYDEVLGLQRVDNATFRVGADAWLQLHATSANHPAGRPKSTAIALLTNQLPEWYTYLQEQQVPIKYTYKPREGGPHDGFVAIDPGGYLLEFEQFKQHPENEFFMAVLDMVEPQITGVDSLNFYASITWTYHRDLLKVQNYYEQVLGFTMVADQGWTKIFQTSTTGFIGLVDERRGMMDYADEKAVEIEWQLNDPDGMDAYASVNWDSYEQETNILVGPEGYRYQLSFQE